jgi:beta-mannosidase
MREATRLPISQKGNVLDFKIQKIGIRRARIVQDKLIDAEGFTFLFEINNIRIFAGGAYRTPAVDDLTNA